MRAPRRALAALAPALLVTLTFANACGSSSGHRTAIPEEAGADDDATVPGTGGRGAGGRTATGTGGKATGGKAAGGGSAGGAPNPPDAGDAGDAAVDAP